MPEEMGRVKGPVPQPVLKRLPRYLNYLKEKKTEELKRISSTVISADLGLNPVQVRKDLAYVSNSGKPRTGFAVNELIRDIERFLGYGNTKDAVLVGAGHLGQALLAYGGFAGYGLNILAAFDVREEVVGTEIHGKPVYPMSRLPELTGRLGAHIGIITVPGEGAQNVCDMLVRSGIKAIWNFAPTHLEIPDYIILQNEDIAASLALLSNRLAELDD